MKTLQKNIHLLEILFPHIRTEAHKYANEHLPFWVNSCADIFIIRYDKNNRIVLILPKKALEYETLVKIQKQVKKNVSPLAIIVADELNSKYRSLFVKNTIPFIFKDESIFAPELGIKLMNFKIKHEKKEIPINNKINPFELKLLAGYLTNYLPQETFILNKILQILENNNYACSLGKLAKTITSLLEKGFLTKTGEGPKRKVKFKTTKEVWAELNGYEIDKTYNLNKSYLADNNIICYAGESVLARHTDLNHPEIETIAVTKKEYDSIIKNTKNKACYYEVRKEDPKLFSKNGCLNLVEVYFSLKNNPDERVQIALNELKQLIVNN